MGAYQCPPDPLGLHPNPLWNCGFDFCSGIPINQNPANIQIIK